MEDVIVIGGGAGGFFTAINIAERFPEKRILILEKSQEGLAKVRISGGGRCNVTNGETIPSEFVKNYPRGSRELRGAFEKFMSMEVMEWFQQRNVLLKIEADERVFPESNNSSSIVNCFLKEVKRLGINVLYKENVKALIRQNDFWEVQTSKNIFKAKKLVITTGSSLKMWDLLSGLGHTIIPPVPSLFTFNTKDTLIENIAGISTIVEASLCDAQCNPFKMRNKRVDNGGLIAPILITHWGFSGPAVLKLSAFGARILAENDYKCILKINWLVEEGIPLKINEVMSILQETKQKHSRKMINNFAPFKLSKNLWLKLLDKSGIVKTQNWAELNKPQISCLAEVLTKSEFVIEGKSTFKEEFVTAGGIDLKEVDFRTFGSKILQDVYFTGEILDIDALTGGFNFQNAWTGGYIISENIF